MDGEDAERGEAMVGRTIGGRARERVGRALGQRWDGSFLISMAACVGASLSAMGYRRKAIGG